MSCTLCQSTEFSMYLECPERYWECKNCSLVWIDKSHLLTPEQEAQRYKLHVNSLEDNIYLKFLSKLALPAQKYIKKHSVGLDFGSGELEGMKEIFTQNKVVSYDPFYHPDTEVLKFSYDFILCSEVVEHFHQPRDEFDLLNSMLKPGGILAVSSALIPSKESFPGWYYRRDPTHVSFYVENTVKWIAQNYSWKILELHTPIWIFEK